MNFLQTLLAISALLAVAMAVAPTFPNTSEKSVGCDACTYVVHWVESEIPVNATISNIKSFLDKACGILPKGVLRDEVGNHVCVCVCVCVCANLFLCGWSVLLLIDFPFSPLLLLSSSSATTS
jgi:Saposin-like type B, region 1